MNTITTQQTKTLMEGVDMSTDDQELVEGVKDILQKFSMKRFQSKFLEKGTSTVYFVMSKERGKFVKAVFENGKLVDHEKYGSPVDMEADINALMADGYKVVNEGKFKKYAKMLVRNLGRIIMVVGIAELVAGSLLIFLMGVSGSGGLIPMVAGIHAAKVAVIFVSGWAIAEIAKKEPAIVRDHGKGMGGVQTESLSQAIREANHEMTEENLRQMIRGMIRDNSLAVTEGLDASTIRGYAANFGKNVGLAAGSLLFIIDMVTLGSVPVGIIAGIGGGLSGTVAGYFIGKNRAVNDPKIRNALMNTQVGTKFDSLVDVVEQRDAILKEIGRYKTFAERNKFSKRVGKTLQRLTSQMQKLSKEIRSDLLEIGDGLDMNEYDKRNLMDFLEKGERGVVSDVLSDRQEVEKLSLDDEKQAA